MASSVRTALTICMLATVVHAQPCPPRWSDTFTKQDMPSTNVYSSGLAAQVFDADGPGPGLPALYLAGTFDQLGTRYAHTVARWDGHFWTGLSSGLPPEGVFSLATFDDDGPGPHLPQLYAGADNVYRFNGSSWDLVGPFLPRACPTCTHSRVSHTLSLDDDGPGPHLAALYAVQYGFDDPPPGSSITEWTSVYRFDGADWIPVHSSPGYPASAAIFDEDDAGPLPPSLMVATQQYQPQSFGRVERFRAGVWGDVLNQPNQYPASMCVFDDDGPGPIPPALYIGGRTVAGSTQVPLSRWNGTTLAPASTGLPGFVNALAAMDATGTGDKLYALTYGLFDYQLYRRDAAAWTIVNSLGAYGWASNMLSLDDDGPGPNPRSIFLIGANFGHTFSASGVARLLSGEPHPPGDGLDNPVHSLVSGDTGIGRRLYAGGTFTFAGPQAARSIAAWQPDAGWTALGVGLAGDVTALRIHDDGHGVALFAGGTFTADGANAPLHHIARWDGTHWSEVGAGFNGPVSALTAFSDGTGVKLYAGGDFTMSGTIPVAHIAQWNGTTWAPVGTGLNGRVLSLLVYNDGAGPRLYAGGQFTAAGSVPAANIASWSGSSWSPLGNGIGAGESSYVTTLTPYTDLGGPALYAAGTFRAASGVVCNSIARWRGGAWTALGDGVQTWVQISASPGYYVPGDVRALMSYDDDGPGPRASALYAAGQFSRAGAASVQCLARWDVTAWATGLAPLFGTGYAMTLMDDDGPGPASPSLYVGGSITAGNAALTGLPLSNLARLAPCPSCYPNCDNSTTTPLLTVNDFVCFLSRFAAGDPYANCDQSTLPPVLNVNDFVCFQQRFASGCP